MTWQQILLGALGAGAAGAASSIGAQASSQNLPPGAAPNVNWQWTGIVAGLSALGAVVQALAQHPAAQQVQQTQPART